MSSEIDADVAIVGYGPTGQTLALLLGRLGHKVVAVDRWPNLYQLPRAVHFDHEIARVLQACGAISDVSHVVEQIDFYQWRNADRELLLELDWRGMGPSGWPISNLFSQPELETVLHKHVQRLASVKILQGWGASELTQDADGVQIRVDRGEIRDGQWQAVGETGRIRARWVVGADGANSFVRSAVGVHMQDLGFAFDWLVVDLKPHEPREWNPKTWQLCDPRRPTTIVPGGPGRRRWEFMLLPGEDATTMNRADVAWRLLEPWGMTPGTAELERHAVYTFRAQWAQQWRVGRALLAGDAAHLMPPFAGQGMCSGMRDSMALSWRFDALLRGLAPGSLIDSYGPERSGHVQEMINFSIELGKVICIIDPEIARQRDAEMIAAQKQVGFQPPPPPQPRLGPGLWSAEAPGAGLLSIQSEIEIDGRRGLFDDVLGVRFAVIARDPSLLKGLSEENLTALGRWKAAFVDVSPEAGVDVTGRYNAWLEQFECEAAFVRPDFYVQGCARNVTELNRIVDHWRRGVNGAEQCS
jgi:2-polyprenyl-6-methoxyphenol hydroxylase-like FAD-dependent oxidoreductase